jgi:aldehyde:ferredoxin oxidoreductase
VFGVFGRYADIDLTTGTVRDYSIPEEWNRLYLGGKGVAARVLLNELSPKAIALSEDNILVFAAGPFQGLNIAGASRFVVMGMSPKTKTINESYGGGKLGHYLGRSGYDGLIIRGRARAPAYILVQDEVVSILPAVDLRGCNPQETEERIQTRHGDVSVACIGIAGENLVVMSCIMIDRNRALARPGFGAVMGSKNLKAVVVGGSRNKTVKDGDRLKELRTQFAKHLLAEGRWQRGLQEFGTGAGIPSFHNRGILPTKNFQTGMFKGNLSISGQRMVESGLLVGRETCPGCPVSCKRKVKGVYNGQEFTADWGGPEYESIAALGSLCLNDNLESICLINQR